MSNNNAEWPNKQTFTRTLPEPSNTKLIETIILNKKGFITRQEIIIKFEKEFYSIFSRQIKADNTVDNSLWRLKKDRKIKKVDKGIYIHQKYYEELPTEEEIENFFRKKLDIKDNELFCQQDVKDTAYAFGINPKNNLFLVRVSKIINKMNLKESNQLSARMNRELPRHPTDMPPLDEFVKLMGKKGQKKTNSPF